MNPLHPGAILSLMLGITCATVDKILVFCLEQQAMAIRNVFVSIVSD